MEFSEGDSCYLRAKTYLAGTYLSCFGEEHQVNTHKFSVWCKSNDIILKFLPLLIALFEAAILHLTMLWAYPADDKLMIFFLIFLENRIRHFMQIVS